MSPTISQLTTSWASWVSPAESEEKRKSAPPVYIDSTSVSVKALSHTATSSIIPSAYKSTEAPLSLAPMEKSAALLTEEPEAVTSVLNPFINTLSFVFAESYTATTWFQTPGKTVPLAPEEAAELT